MNQKEVLTCPQCSTSFFRKRITSKFCSRTCSQRAKGEIYRVTGKSAAWQYKNYVKKTYGLSLEDVQRLNEEQAYRCKICSIHVNDLTGKKKKLCVDHCHTTGKVRGLLCEVCNSMLGMARDSTITLQAAIAYLESTK